MFLRLVLWGLLLYIGYRIVLSLTKAQTHQSTSGNKREDTTTIHKDPVCGIYVSEEEAIIGSHDGQRLYFCSHACLEKYRENLDHTRN